MTAMGTSSSKSTGSKTADADNTFRLVWAKQLTGSDDTPIHTVVIQTKGPSTTPFEPYNIQASTKVASHVPFGQAYWLRQAKRAVDLQRESIQWDYELRPNETYAQQKARKQAKLEAVPKLADPKLLYYTEGGVSATSDTDVSSFFMALYQSYMCHGEVVFSPDDVWQQIQMSLSRYINENPETAERLRSQLVDFQGRKTITVQIPAPVGGEVNLNWPLFCDEVRKAMAKNMRPDVVDDVTPVFSTTGPFQKLVSQTMAMDCFKTYFEMVMRMSCGITKVHFLGTQGDWEALPTKLEALRKFSDNDPEGTEWVRYIDRLLPVLNKLAAARAGDVDVSWFNGVIDEKHSRGYGGGTPAELTGWALRFMYGLPDKVEDIADIPNFLARVPVVIDDHGIRDINVKLFTGFSGLAVATADQCVDDPRRHVFRAHTSFAVIREREQDEKEIVNDPSPPSCYVPGNPANYEVSTTVAESSAASMAAYAADAPIQRRVHAELAGYNAKPAAQ